MPETTEPTFGDITKLFFQNLLNGFKTVLTWLVRYPVALVLAIFVVVGGFMLLKSGIDINIGGILKYLFGRPKGSESVVAAANTVSDKRVREDGSEIPVGEADDNGWTQWETREWTTPTNPFRDKGTITVTTAEGKDHEVQLPTGIQDTDVESVIEVRPQVYVVKTNSESKHSARDLLNGLPTPRA